jgi:hypothetical protein
MFVVEGFGRRPVAGRVPNRRFIIDAIERGALCPRSRHSRGNDSCALYKALSNDGGPSFDTLTARPLQFSHTLRVKRTSRLMARHA